MKKFFAILLLLSLIILTVGCSKDKSTNIQDNRRNFAGRQQFIQTPEMKLRRAVMQIQQLEKSEMPITKEQAQKLIPIINEIKAKELIDQTYADKKSEEIRNIFTDQQKEFLDENQNGFRQKNAGQNRQDKQPPLQNGGERRLEQRDNQRRSIQTTKDFYEQIIEILEEKTK